MPGGLAVLVHVGGNCIDVILNYTCVLDFFGVKNVKIGMF